MGLGSFPPWPFLTSGVLSVTTPPVNPVAPWAKPTAPNPWDGFAHFWDSNVHSASSVGVDYTLKVNILPTWYVHADNDLLISTATWGADP